MWHHLKGNVYSRNNDHLVVECGGVGYIIYSPLDVTHHVKEGDDVFLFLHHHFTLDQTRAQENLYGFLNLKDRTLFRKLITVKGIGPRIALDILSGCGRDALVNAIRQQDTALLKKFKGIGAKSAERLVVELKGQLENFSGSDIPMSPVAPNKLNDTAMALQTLGYKEDESQKSAKKAIAENPNSDVAELVRAALRLF